MLSKIQCLSWIVKNYSLLLLARGSGGEVLWSVTSVYLHVCASVCLSARISPEPHAWSLPIFVHVAYSHGSVVLRQGDKVPRGRGNLGFFSPLTMHCNEFAANNVMQQQNEPFRRCRGWWECTARANCDLRLPCLKQISICACKTLFNLVQVCFCYCWMYRFHFFGHTVIRGQL